MSSINFNKEQLSDLEFSLKREILLANDTGAYYSTTIANCHTRKYHGLFIVPQPQIDDNRYVLLSSLDETIVRKEQKMHLAAHRYPDTYFPQGYRHLESFSYKHIPQWIVKAEDIELCKEVLIVQNEDRVLTRYTVTKADAPFELRFDPFLSFRNIHTLGKVNMNGHKKTGKADNGASYKLYDGFSTLFLQFSRKPDFVAAPDWYYNIEYTREQERGYDYKEDLYTPGYFKIKLKKGDSVVFSAATSEIAPRKLSHLFEREIKSHHPLNNFSDYLENAGAQFIIYPNDETEIMAGYHWFGPWGRDTFIALPGLTLATGKPELCKKIIDANLKYLKNGLFPNVGRGENAAYNSADASLWFFWALQQYTYSTGTIGAAWEDYGDVMRSILNEYRKGTLYNIHMEDNGLLYAGSPGIAVTWMDAIVNGKPVTPRTGFAVELNALWYNAVCFALECAQHANDKNFIHEWYSLSEQINVSFTETFWNEEKGYLADCVNGSHHDWSLRPNQVIAASLPFSPINGEIKGSVLTIVKDKLLTPRGLRTLSPDDREYKGLYYGDQNNRDHAYHQGTVWPWLFGHFAEASLKMDNEGAKKFIETMYENFTPAINEYGVGTIAEIYDGEAPYNARGAISQAWSVAELLRTREMLKGHLYKRVVKKGVEETLTI